MSLLSESTTKVAIPPKKDFLRADIYVLGGSVQKTDTDPLLGSQVSEKDDASSPSIFRTRANLEWYSVFLFLGLLDPIASPIILLLKG
jgi:hypothetical protein